ncbi:MAG: AMP-binding protein, partial [Actinomycetota bacterium]
FTDWAGDRFDIRAGKTVLNYAPLNFDLCLLDIWATLKLGGSAVLVDPQRATNAGYLLDLLASREVHVIQAVPMLYRLLVDATRESGQRFDAVEHVIFTGYSIPSRTLMELPRLFGRARLYNVYGCTETNDSFLHEVEGPVSPGAPIPLGQPLPGVQALIVGEDDKVLEGVGTGELLVMTPFQAHGYTDRALNDSKFVGHPEGRDRLRYFRSGDLVRRHEDGSLTLEGRKDFLVKVRGVGVNMGEIERVLLEHGQVVEAAVVAVPDPLAGHRLHALVRRASSSALNSLVLRQHCAERLARAAIPSTLQIVEDPLPRTSTGKVDRKVIERTRTKGN